MQIKNFSPPGPDDHLQDQLISADAVILKDEKLDSLFDKLSIVDQKDEEENRSCGNSADDSDKKFDESQLVPKGPSKGKHFSARDLPYEPRTLSRHLMNGGALFQNFSPSFQRHLHGRIPITVQEFQSRTVPTNVFATDENYYQTCPPFLSSAVEEMKNANIPPVLQADWNALLPSISRTARVDSPLSSDSGVNSPSSSPNRGSFQTLSSGQFASYPVTVRTPESQAVGSPCSQESGYSPSGSVESQLWPHDQLSPERGFYETPNQPVDEGKISYSSNDWSLNSFGTMNIQSDWQYQRDPYYSDGLAPSNHSAMSDDMPGLMGTVWATRTADEQRMYPSNIPLDSLRPSLADGLQSGQTLLEQWTPEQLEEFCKELVLSNLDSSEATQPESPLLRSTPTPQPNVPETTPKIKNSRPKTKPTRPERTPQQKRKTNKGPPPLDRTKPKICYMIDHKKEGTKAMWMGISLMSEEKFTKKNDKGQTCLMEVLLAEKLSLERCYFIVQRMKKNGDLLASKDKYGKNALYLAAIQHPHIPELASLIAESYVHQGLDVNEGFFGENNSLIHCLVEKGESHRVILSELLDLKVDDRRVFNPNVANSIGDTPVHLALRNMSKESHPFDLSFVDILLKRGASISIQNSEGETPMHLAAKIACDEKVFRKLFERLSLPPEEKQDAMNMQDNDGNTPLHLVAYHINPCNEEKMKKVIKVFLEEKHTRTDIRNNEGSTPVESIHQSCVREFHDLFHRRK